MWFYYENNMGDTGTFKENNLVKAIYTAWNIEAKLYLIDEDTKKINRKTLHIVSKLIFSPMDDNELNSELLKEFGYRMIDKDGYRCIANIKTGKIEKYEWFEVKQLI